MTKTSLDKSKIKILLLEGIHPSAVDAFRQDGYTEIEHHPKSLPPEQLKKALSEAYFIGIRSATELTAEVLDAAPVVTLHVPETPQTFCMIGADELARMKPGARLINAARGTVVDIPALVDALKGKHLSGAALDVYPAEPKTAKDEFVSPLREFDNVILTPHVGGSTEEAQESIGEEVALKLIKYSNNGSTLSAVNFPEVSLPEHPGKHRLLHIHHNQPGVLSAINAIFSEARLNIAAEYLQTDPKIGYVVIDIEGDEPAESLQLKRRMDAIPGTIRTRILY